MDSSAATERMQDKARALALLAVVVCLILAAIFAPHDAIADLVADRHAWRGPWGVTLFVALYVVWNFALPPAPLQALAGAYYGLDGGLAVIVVSTTLANVVSHGIGRLLARNYIRRKVDESRRLAAIDASIRCLGWKGVALLRLSNLIPSNIANLLMGATSLRLSTILWASIVGSLPGWVLMLAVGRSGLALLGGEGMSPLQAVAYGLSAVAALALMVGLGRYARRNLGGGQGP